MNIKEARENIKNGEGVPCPGCIPFVEFWKSKGFIEGWEARQEEVEELKDKINRLKTGLKTIGSYCGLPMDKFKEEYMVKDVEKLLRDIIGEVKFWTTYGMVE